MLWPQALQTSQTVAVQGQRVVCESVRVGSLRSAAAVAAVAAAAAGAVAAVEGQAVGLLTRIVQATRRARSVRCPFPAAAAAATAAAAAAAAAASLTLTVVAWVAADFGGDSTVFEGNDD
jgi:hypothetical protein